MKIFGVSFIVFFVISFAFGQCQKNVKINRIAGPYVLSEGPHWDDERNLLYFVDIPEQRIYSYQPTTGRITYTHLKCGPVSVVVPVAGRRNTFIAGCGTELVQVHWNSHTINRNPRTEVLSRVDIGVPGTRFNDGKVDPRGRFWAGTMLMSGRLANPPDQASLYRFAYNGTPTTMITPVSISNGLVWSHSNNSFYYIDSLAYNVVVYDYNDTTGDISNKRTLLDFKKNNISGVPDGMTIDKAGNLWVAVNAGGGRVIQVDPRTGRVLRSVVMPVTDVSSVAFGGRNKDILYVTSARDQLTESQLREQPLAGSVFAVHGLGVSGSPMLASRIMSPEEIKFERIDGPYMCAEGPHWDHENNRLYYVDIIGHKILCYSPITGKVTQAYLKCGSIGFVIPAANKKNTFITACGTNLIQVSWDPVADDLDPRVEFISQVDVGVSDTRFNDAKVDPAGRLWAGTMGEKNGLPVSGKGSLYRFDYDGTPKKMISPVDISNGLVWSLTKDSFYYIDSFAYVIDVYDYDDATGDISNKRTLFDLKANNITGIADGMTIDKTGNLWIANHSGGTVFQVDSKTGKLLRTIKMPMRDATSVAFGGPNKDVLYVTSSKDKMSEDLLQEQPLAGSVIAVYGLGATGLPMVPCKIQLK
ncbi:uncharacterized protein LOC141534118 [Cotesia typhae]|uniref:uncharacterized protein LOC141534118 n=1 Tax=Cotesia typhae TaxID=2053667 RepID=UPI003D689A67